MVRKRTGYCGFVRHFRPKMADKPAPGAGFSYFNPFIGRTIPDGQVAIRWTDSTGVLPSRG